MVPRARTKVCCLDEEVAAMEWAYLAAGVGPMSIVLAVGFWADLLAKLPRLERLAKRAVARL